MTIAQVIRAILAHQGVNGSLVYKRLGIQQQVFYSKLIAKSMRVESATEILRVLDYKLVAMPTNAKVPEGAYEVER